MPLNAPGLLHSLTTFRAAAAKAAKDAREAAVRIGTVNPEERDRLLALAADLEALAGGTPVLSLIGTLLDEAKDAALTGLAVVVHSPTDIF